MAAGHPAAGRPRLGPAPDPQRRRGGRVTQSLPGARQAPFTTAKDTAGREVTVHGPAIDHEYSSVVSRAWPSAAAFVDGAVVAFGTNLVPDGQVTLVITDIPQPARHIRVPAVEVTTASYMGQELPSFVISRQTAHRLGLPGLAEPPVYLVRAARPLSDAQCDSFARCRPASPRS